MNQQPNIGKICLYATDRYESKYQLLISKQENKITSFKLFYNIS